MNKDFDEYTDYMAIGIIVAVAIGGAICWIPMIQDILENY